MFTKIFTYVLFILVWVQVTEHCFDISVNEKYHHKISSENCSKGPSVEHHISHFFGIQKISTYSIGCEWVLDLKPKIFTEPEIVICSGVWRPPKPFF